MSTSSTHLYLTATCATNPDLFALREVPGQPSVLLPCVRSHRVIDPMTMVADLCKRYNVCIYGPVDLLKVNDSPLNTVWALRATYGTLDTLKPVGVSTLSLKETLDRLLVEFGFFWKIPRINGRVFVGRFPKLVEGHYGPEDQPANSKRTRMYFAW